LREQGFKNVLIVDGGFPEYEKAGCPVVPKGGEEPGGAPARD
jgi:rhodanese-related sulfurtransferase